MGLDLTLVPNRYPQIGGWFLAYDRISLDRQYALFDAIRDQVDTFPLEDDTRFQWYGDEGLEDVREDPYGSPLRWCFAKDLSKIRLSVEDLSAWNRGVVAFVRSLPPDTKIVLWWN